MFNVVQTDKLKEHEHIYTLFVQAQVISNAHQAITEINNVYQEVYGNRFQQWCGGCVSDALNRIYKDYYTQINQL